MRTILLCLLAASSPVHATELIEARAFFDEFVDRSNRFDSSVADFYSDNATIHTLRDGKERLQLTGKEWKLLYEKAMPIAKLRGDTSTYSDVSITPKGDGFRISAVRWSTVKCYKDMGFYVDVARGHGKWTILEQHSDTVSLSQCKPSDEVAFKLKAIRDGILPHLPLDLDADTRLDSVEIVDSALVYGQVLHTISEREMDMAAFVPLLRQLSLNNVCGSKEMSSLLNLGATIRYVYVDRNDVRLAAIDVFPGLCN